VNLQKNLMHFILGLFLGAFVASPILACEIRVLTYSSMLGKSSLGEWIEQEWRKVNPHRAIKFEAGKELSGLWGSLKKEQKTKKTTIDIVLGLEEHHYQEALSKNWVEAGFVFDQSPFAIVVNQKKFTKNNWPKNWKELPGRLEKKLLLQDPHLSNTGNGWIQAIYVQKLLDAKLSTQVISRIFPSWSSSYDAFTKSLAPAVWTYLSSVSYHQCEEKSQDYTYLALEEGYPVQKEWVASLASRSSKADVKKFLEFLKSASVQEQIPLKNWMYPGVSAVKLPNCFVKMDAVKNLQNDAKDNWKEWEHWIDQWSLL
jgi:ABC transporter substrate-binding protein (ThiB subfamily)